MKVARRPRDETEFAWRIEGGRVLADGRLEARPLTIAGGRIAEAPPGVPARSLDAAGCLVLPGIVDIHGDAFERVVMPRPGVAFPIDLALAETDRQLAGNGITTAYHGITVSWEPGLRSLDHARELVAAFAEQRAALGCDARLHLRWETFALDAMETVAGWLAEAERPILAFNDHTTKSAKGREDPRKLAQMAERTGLPREDFAALMAEVWDRRADVPAAIETMAAHGRTAGAVLLAHDETSPADRRRFRALGARASEFPLTVDTAREARAHGEPVVLGAPNLVRGGSHTGAMRAADAIAADLCTVLASDYYYPAPLHAAFKAVADGLCDLPAAWALISENPARLAGLDDRGTLAPGKRADVVVVDTSGRRPEIVAVFAGGTCVGTRGDRRLDG